VIRSCGDHRGGDQRLSQVRVAGEAYVILLISHVDGESVRRDFLHVNDVGFTADL
jgi:hypothetical protein